MGVKILITGANGQLGRDAVSVLGEAHETVGVDLPEVDLADAAQVARLMGRVQPDAVVNCAAYTRVDDAERDREICRRVNAEAPGLLARAAAAAGASLAHISTDYVFDGRRPAPRPYVEDDPPNPASWYGRTKLEGEGLLAQAGGRWAVLRTAWLYGRHGHNFPRAILRQVVLHPGRPLRVVNDQHGSPTWSWRLAEQIRAVVEAGGQGIYHATAEGAGTWFDFAVELLALLGLRHEVVPCGTVDYPTAAARPANSILENARLKREGRNVFRDWREDLRAFASRHGASLLEDVWSAARAGEGRT